MSENLQVLKYRYFLVASCLVGLAIKWLKNSKILSLLLISPVLIILS